MPFVFKSLALLLSISARPLRRTRRHPSRRAPPAVTPATRATHRLPSAWTPSSTSDKVALAFGKLNPNQYGVLPVLVVIQNDSDKAIRLDRLKVEYAGPNHDRVEATPAKDVRYLQAAAAARRDRGPAGKVKVLRTKKNPAGRVGDRRPRHVARRCCRPDNRPAASSISRPSCSRTPPCT